MKRYRPAGIIAACAIAALAAPAVAQDGDPLLNKASVGRTRGAATATVAVYEFADFQCAHCAQFARDVYPRIDSAYIRPGKVRWIFVNLPVPSHPAAWAAHEAAVCAGAIADGFWIMHDLLFARQSELARAADPNAFVRELAREARVPANEFDACVTGDRVAPLLVQDLLFAGNTRVTGTPAFIINQEQSVMGVKSFEEWKAILDRAIAARGGGDGQQR